jgi:hypothetical protein
MSMADSTRRRAVVQFFVFLRRTFQEINDELSEFLQHAIDQVSIKPSPSMSLLWLEICPGLVKSKDWTWLRRVQCPCLCGRAQGQAARQIAGVSNALVLANEDGRRRGGGRGGGRLLTRSPVCPMPLPLRPPSSVGGLVRVRMKVVCQQKVG